MTQYPSESSSSPAKLLKRLDEAGIHYAILHGWGRVDEPLHSDIDIVLTSKDLKELEEYLCSTDLGRVVQVFYYRGGSFTFVLSRKNKENSSFVLLDATTSYRSRGRIFFTGENLLQERRRWKEFWVLSPRKELAYLFVKKIYEKGFIPEHQKVRLQELVQEVGEQASLVAQSILGNRWGRKVVQWVVEGRWTELEMRVSQLRRAISWQVIKRHPVNPIHYWVQEMGRFWYRWRYPTGLFVATLGPDGAGKSTLIGHLQENLLHAFPKTAVFHLRPSLISKKSSSASVTDPHQRPPYPSWVSSLKIAYYLADYVLGYWFRVRIKLVRSTLVLFDRYYDDLLVDSYRYRYAGPEWLVNLARWFVPQPDLFLVLDVPEEQLLARKGELPLRELQRQRKAYRKLTIRLRNAYLLDGSLTPKEVSRTAGDVILDHLSRRYLERHRKLFGGSALSTLGWLSSVLNINPGKTLIAHSHEKKTKPRTQWKTFGLFGWLALNDGRGYLIPLCSRQAATASLDLYNAQNLRARFGKSLMSIGLKWGVGSHLLPKVTLLTTEGKAEGLSGNLLLEHLREVLGRDDLMFAISLGTPGSHRKPVLQVLTSAGEARWYVKVGWNAASCTLVQREAEILRRISTASFKSFIVPAVIYSGWWNGRFFCIQSAPESRPQVAPQHMIPEYLRVLWDVASFHSRRVSLKESIFWKGLLERTEKVPNTYYHHILEQSLERVEKSIGEEELPFHLRHGDFAPWNFRLVKGQMYILDWEYADLESPPGWDLFHFLIQTQSLLEKQPPCRILTSFQKGERAYRWLREFSEPFDLKDELLGLLLMLYLLDRLSFYASNDNLNFEALRKLSMMSNLCTYRGFV